MNIRIILYVFAALTMAITMAMVAMSFYLSAEIRGKINDSRIAAELARSSSELALLTEEYIAYRLERVEIQWESKIKSVYNLVNQVDESELNHKLGRDIYSLNEAFREFRDTAEQLEIAGKAGAEGSTKRLILLEQRRITRIRLLYTELSRSAFRFSEQLRDQASILQQRINFLVTAYGIGLAIVLGLSMLLLIRVIVGKLSALGDRAVAIGQGDLSARIPDLGKDEFGQLGNLVNEMTDELQRMSRVVQQNNQALRESEQRFRDFARTAADYFWEIDSGLNIVRLEGNFASIMGASTEQTLGSSLEAFLATGLPDESQGRQLLRLIREQQIFEDFELDWSSSQGVARVVAISGNPRFDGEDLFAGYRGSGRDITQTHQLTRELSYQATHDSLTNLINRREFERRLNRLLGSTHRHRSRHLLFILDLDRFKIVNDTCGHIAGDELLKEIASLFQEQLRGRDTLARLGGDEFGVLIEHCSLSDGQLVAEKMRRAVDEYRLSWEGKVFNISLSIGIVSISPEFVEMANLMRAADGACYAAKEQGGNRSIIYQPEDSAQALRQTEMYWVAKINNALDEDRFRLYFQRIVPAIEAEHAADHIELLLRMEDESGELVAPGVFLPIAERFNLSTRLDRWVIGRAFDWLEEHPDYADKLELCAINLSGHSLGDSDFRSFLNARLRALNIPTHNICFEITETAAIRNLGSAIELIESVKQHGCKLALDDFGSGLSSFSYLKNLPVDYLKIDGGFIVDLLVGPFDLAFVKSINEVGHSLGKKTVAEFVENKAIAEKLTELGVDCLQGYHFGHPRPVDDLLKVSTPSLVVNNRSGRP